MAFLLGLLLLDQTTSTGRRGHLLPGVSGLPGSGEKTAVKLGDPYKVNCTSSCPQPQIIGLETTLKKVVLNQQAQWTEYLVYNISQDSVLFCHFTCSGTQKSTPINVSVFRECHTLGPPSPGQSPCLLNGHEAAITAPGHLCHGPHLPGPGVTRNRTQAMGSGCAHTLHWPP